MKTIEIAPEQYTKLYEDLKATSVKTTSLVDRTELSTELFALQLLVRSAGAISLEVGSA